MTNKGPTCRRCEAPIIFIIMLSGAKMPCDPLQVYGDGYRTLIVRDERLRGHMVQRASPEVLGFVPHWGTCPHANHFKKKKPKQKPTPAPSLFDAIT